MRIYDNQRQGPLALAYIAAIIDGEGSIMITRSTSGKGRKTPSYTPRVKVQMTTLPCIQFIVDHTGLGKINKEEDRKVRGNRRPLYQWQIHSLGDCHKFCDLIMPFIVLKEDQCALMLAYCENFGKTEYRTYGVPDDVREYREEAYRLMGELNSRHSAAETESLSIREDEATVRP